MLTRTQTRSNQKTNLEELIPPFIDKLPDLLSELQLEFRVEQNRITSTCPIHDGDNKGALNLYTDEEKKLGNWKCWTNGCERKYGTNFFGFIIGLLTKQYNRPVEFKEALSWLIKYLKFDNIQFNKNSNVDSYSDFNRIVDIVKEKKEPPPEYIEECVSKLIIPSQYYVDRGYKKETLEYFQVGLCAEKGHNMFTRTVVPVFNCEKTGLVGIVARSTQPKCPKCSLFHFANRECPKNDLETFWGQKWINSKGFRKSHYLYNHWNLGPTDTVVLVEGQGDVWRLYEAGIKNCVGMFGCRLSNEQTALLDSLGVMNLIVALDSDKAGLEGKEDIVKRCSRYYNIKCIELPNKDFGDMSIDEVKQLWEKIF
jgi:5S rRNA maturation endonuclease (ribonuclease M5)